MSDQLFLATIKLQLTDSIEKNIPLNSKYLEYRCKVFYELEDLLIEIAKCRILSLNHAVVTATNYLLERLLKLALIHKSAGIGSKKQEDLSTVYSGPSMKYGSIRLGNAIEHCKKENLIDSEEKEILFNYIRETIRNGFSHADVGKILSDMPDEKEYYLANTENKQWEVNKINPKVVPQIQAAHIQSFANETAFFYFDFVFDLLVKIESRLIDFNK